MGKFAISMVIFNSHVSLLEGNMDLWLMGWMGCIPTMGFWFSWFIPVKLGMNPYELIDNLGCMGDLWEFHYGRLMDEENHGFQYDFHIYISHIIFQLRYRFSHDLEIVFGQS